MVLGIRWSFMEIAALFLMAASLSNPTSAATTRYEITMTATAGGTGDFIARFEVDDALTLTSFQAVVNGHGWDLVNLTVGPAFTLDSGNVVGIDAEFDNLIIPAGEGEFLVFTGGIGGAWFADTVILGTEGNLQSISGTYRIARIEDGGGSPDPVVDHYLCYDAKTPKEQAQFVPIEDVNLKDQFHEVSPLVVDVTKAKFVCTPVDKSGATIVPTAARDLFGTHLTCYEVKNPEGTPKLTDVGVDVVMTNQLDAAQPIGQSQNLEVKKPKVVCVPSEKTVVSNPTPTGDGCLAGKPTSLTFQFVADVPPGDPNVNFLCSASNNLQPDGKFSCTDGPGVFDPANPVGITLTKDADSMGIETDPAIIMVGTSVTVASKIAGERMRSNVRLSITQNVGGVEQVLQTLQIHASCSAPLSVGDVFGSLKLTEFVVAP